MKVIMDKEPVEDWGPFEFRQYAEKMPYAARRYLQKVIPDQLKQYEDTGTFRIPGLIDVNTYYPSRNTLAEHYLELVKRIKELEGK